MIRLTDRIYAHRAVMALHTLFGGAGHAIYEGASIPGAIRLTEPNCIAAAGDHERPLAIATLKPLALKHNCPVIATYLDPFKAGHRFQFDLVLLHDGTATLFCRYRLWIPQREAMHFVPEHGDGPCIGIGAGGLIEAGKPPFRNQARRTLGVARGQAELESLIYSGPGFARPSEHWLDY